MAGPVQVKDQSVAYTDITNRGGGEGACPEERHLNGAGHPQLGRQSKIPLDL